MLFVDAKKVLEQINGAVGVGIVMRPVSGETAAKTVARIVRVNAIRFGVVCVDDFQVVVAASNLFKGVGFGCNSL